MMPRRSRPNLTLRRLFLHLFCLGLVGLGATGPLSELSTVGTRPEVAEAVRRYARFIEARADYDSNGGWRAPRIPITLEELNQVNPPAPALPAVGPGPIVVASTIPSGEVTSLPSARIPTLGGPIALTVSREREAAREALSTRFATLPDSYGVVVTDISGIPIFEHRANTQFQAASLYKLGVAAEVYRQIKVGLVSAQEKLTVTKESLVEGDTIFAARDVGRKVTIGEAVDYMVTRSSNVSAMLLLKRISPRNVNDLFVGLGLNDTRLLDRPFRNVDGNAKNQTTPRDMALFFRLLLHDRVVDAETSQQILALLLRQRIDDRLPAWLPADVQIAHKTGNLVGVVHDAGIIYTRVGPLVTVVLSENVASEEEARAVISQVARVAFDAYTRLAVPPVGN